MTLDIVESRETETGRIRRGAVRLPVDVAKAVVVVVRVLEDVLIHYQMRIVDPNDGAWKCVEQNRDQLALIAIFGSRVVQRSAICANGASGSPSISARNVVEFSASDVTTTITSFVDALNFVAPQVVADTNAFVAAADELFTGSSQTLFTWIVCGFDTEMIFPEEVDIVCRRAQLSSSNV